MVHPVRAGRRTPSFAIVRPMTASTTARRNRPLAEAAARPSSVPANRRDGARAPTHPPRSAAHAFEIACLIGLALMLPILEAPKNVLWFAWMVTWFVERARRRDFGGPWTGWDTLIAVWIASGFVVAAFAGVRSSEWGGATDLLRYGSILWLVTRARYRTAELVVVLLAVIVATLVGLVYGWWQWGVTHARGFIELKSVGHVNHSSIYVAIVFGAATSAVLAYWRGWSAQRRVVMVALVGALAGSLVAMESRGAIGVAVVLAVVLGLAWGRRSKALAAATVGLVVLGIVTVLVVRPEVVRKQERVAASDNVLSFRDGIWRMAFAMWERHPVFGVGMDNYSRVSPADVERWKTARGETFVPERYIGTSHAHSLYMNTLAERGAVGALALAAVLVGWLVSLARNLPRRDAPPEAWLLWGAALSAWLVTVGVGFVNTTLHHEHGILAALLLALWLAWLRGRPRRGRRRAGGDAPAGA